MFFDLDGDGIPEIVENHCAGFDDCGVHLTGTVARWNGTRYHGDVRHYAAIGSSTVGQPADTYEFHSPATPDEPLPAHYILHVCRGRGIRSVVVRVDGEKVVAGRLELENDCHTIAVTVRGKQGARAWAMIEERP